MLKSLAFDQYVMQTSLTSIKLLFCNVVEK